MEALANGNGEDCGTHSYLSVFMKSEMIQRRMDDQGDEEDGMNTMIWMFPKIGVPPNHPF